MFNKGRHTCIMCDHELRQVKYDNLFKKGSRSCSKCGIYKESADFNRGCSVCRNCQAFSERARKERIANIVGLRKCNKCGTEKDASEFAKGMVCCKECMNVHVAQTRRGYDAIKTKRVCTSCGKEKLPHHFNKGWLQCKSCQNKYRNGHWIRYSLKRHQNLGITILTTENEIILSKDVKNCYICGKKLSHSVNGRPGHRSPTLDRMNNEKYMDINNTQIVCMDCNRMKRHRTLAEYLNYLNNIRKYDFVVTRFDPYIYENELKRGLLFATVTIQKRG